MTSFVLFPSLCFAEHGTAELSVDECVDLFAVSREPCGVCCQQVLRGDDTFVVSELSHSQVLVGSFHVFLGKFKASVRFGDAEGRLFLFQLHRFARVLHFQLCHGRFGAGSTAPITLTGGTLTLMSTGGSDQTVAGGEASALYDAVDTIEMCRVVFKTGKFVESKTGMAKVSFLQALARALSSPASVIEVSTIRNPQRQMPSRGPPRQSAPPTALDPLRGQRWLRHVHARRLIAVSGPS